MKIERQEKIRKLLALANDANDAESMSALAKAQQLMIEYQISEDDIFQYKQKQLNQEIITAVLYTGKPNRWMYDLARIIAKNFRVKFYYDAKQPINLKFVGLTSDIHIAEITFQYAAGSISYCARSYMQKPEIKRKRKRKWSLKQDYIQGYLVGLADILDQQVLTNGYELALQLPVVVRDYVNELGLTQGKDTSRKITDYAAFESGVSEGKQFKSHEQIEH